MRKFFLSCLVLGSLSLTLSPSAQASPDLEPATSQVVLHVQPGDGYRPIIDFIRSARKTLDFTIYQFNDGRIARELKAAQRRGVDVRVIFTWQVFPAGSNLWDPFSSNYNTNMPTFNSLQKAGIDVRLSPFTYTYSHEKTMIADGGMSEGRALIMDFNSQPSYLIPTPGLLGTRGFAVTTSNIADVREIQEVFDADWERRPPRAFISPRLVWSPNGVGYLPKSQGKDRIFALIDKSTKSLDLYVLLLDYLPFQDRLIAAEKRGVDVRIITNTNPKPMSFDQLSQLVAAGVEFRFDPTYAGGPVFIHSKAIIRDAGTRNAMAFVGSQNSGDNVSMNSERELGILLGKDTQVDRMNRIFDEDWAVGSPITYEDESLVDPFWITYPSPSS
jgi:phosphatidylserine/phosphatidylglycerophosphate/cardiolipin synthase-like enzyme